MKKKWFLILIFCIGISCPTAGFCSLKTYLKKYLHASISTESIEKLSSYDRFIDYFSALYYFRPHYRVNPDFIRALILAESSGNPNALSKKGAIGLGQILFTTGKRAASELAQTGYSFKYVKHFRLLHLRRKDLYDPAINILLTCYLISKYNNEYDGKLDLVLTAWNAGDNTESLDSSLPAPYHETFDLIGKVNGYYLYLLDHN